jgi:copper chaperone CopZ
MTQTLNLALTGMHCESCIKRVTMALQSLPGVQVHSVELGSAQITFNQDEANEAQVLASIARIGFLANVKG